MAEQEPTAADLVLPDELREIADTAFEATVHGGYHRLPTDLSATQRKQIWSEVFSKRRSRLVRIRVRNRSNKKKLPFPSDADRSAMIEKHIQTHGVTMNGEECLQMKGGGFGRYRTCYLPKNHTQSCKYAS